MSRVRSVMWREKPILKPWASIAGAWGPIADVSARLCRPGPFARKRLRNQRSHLT